MIKTIHVEAYENLLKDWDIQKKEILVLKDQIARRNMQIKELKKRINELTPCWQHKFVCEGCQYYGDCADQNKLNR